MKYLKKYKLFETGEWSSDVDWEYVKNNPDDDSEEAGWIRTFVEDLEYIQYLLEGENEITFEIIDVKGQDMYSGPYATVNINGKNYTIWNGDPMFIENFPIINTDSEERDGFKGNTNEIAQAVINSKPINMATRKYNL